MSSTTDRLRRPWVTTCAEARMRRETGDIRDRRSTLHTPPRATPHAAVPTAPHTGRRVRCSLQVQRMLTGRPLELKVTRYVRMAFRASYSFCDEPAGDRAPATKRWWRPCDGPCFGAQVEGEVLRHRPATWRAGVCSHGRLS